MRPQPFIERQETKMKKKIATMLTIKEAAALVDGLSQNTIRQWCIKGELKHNKGGKTGKTYLINKSVLLEYLGEDLNKYEQSTFEDCE
jgi:excisionase family DNA binding protein